MLTELPEGWVRPWWAERQLDPNSAAHAPAPSRVHCWDRDRQLEASLLANTVGRSWTTIGLPETVDQAEVDPRGLVVCGRWSLDWWVRAGEEWVFPSRAASVRQRLVDGMPVVETVLRVGNGDVTHRVAAARGSSVPLGSLAEHVRPRRGRHSSGDRSDAVPEVFVVEVSNRTPEPVAVALAVRPCHLGAFEHADREVWEWSNAWGLHRIIADGPMLRLDDGQGHAVGLATVIFDRIPGEVVVAVDGIDCAAVLGGSRSRSDDVPAACPQRLANAAAVFPLVAGATLRAAVVGRGSAFEWDDAGSPALGAAVLGAVPSLDRVANGWRQRVDAGCRLELPAGRLADAVLAARAAQLLSTAPFDDGPGVVGPMLASALATDAQFAGDDLVQLLALVESGAQEQVRDLLLRQAQAQDASGATFSMGHPVTGTSLVLAEHLLALHPDPSFAEGIGEFVAAAARRLLARGGVQTETAWTVREGLRAGYRQLMRLGAERAATALRRAAMRLPEAQRVDPAEASASPSFYRDRAGRIPWTTPRRGASAAPPGQRWEWISHDTGLWIHGAVPWAPPLSFVSTEPVDGMPPDFVEDTAASCGHDLVATALLAFAEARPAPARSFARLESVLSVASSTLNWPTFMDPQLRTGTNGTGHDLMVGGLFVRTLLRLLVDVPDNGMLYEAQQPTLRLAAHWPAAWLGQPVEVHDVPTRIGKVSWAVRWHGERPALLWDVVPHDPDGGAPAVTAPGLDPTFAATGWRGEALLAPHPA